MNLSEYMRKAHPAPLTYLAPKEEAKPKVEMKTIHISIKHFDLARAFVLVTITLAIFLPGKWAILASVVGNGYWLYKIR